MLHRLLLLLLAASSCIAACSEVDPSNPQEVDGGIVVPNGAPNVVTPGPAYRVATMNVRFFFDTFCDSGRCESEDFEREFSEAEFAFKADQLAEGIRAMEADAVLLQEVESEAALVGLYERLDDIYNIAIIGETGGAASLDTAILARGSFLGTEGHRDVPLTRPDGSQTTFAREFLEVRLELDGQRIHLFSAHFKAKRNDDPGRRLAEAAAARDIAYVTSQDFPDAVVIVGGDLNDTPDSEPIEAMTAGNFLSLVEGPADDWWTYSFGQERDAIDHILIVENGRGTFSEPLSIFRDGTGGYASSDHSAVAADFQLPVD